MSSSVAERLARTHKRIGEACLIAGRRPEEITLVAVSKRQPVERLREAIAAGQHVLGENQLQEAEGKIAQLGAPSEGGTEQGASSAPRLWWHMIGPLQSNKAKRAARLFDVIHSLDRPKIARLLDREAATLGRRLEVFVQVNVGREASKHGFAVDRFEEEVRPLAELTSLDIAGLMAIPPFEQDPGNARRWFAEMRRLRDRAAAWPEWSDFPGRLSMGMSRDLEAAIAEGATHVRVGTDIFGPRPG